MVKIIALSGSLRKASYNTALLRAAVALSDGQIEQASIRDIPLYDGDLESQAFPPAVQSLQRSISEADGLMLFSPEYNRSLPGVLKNTMDWLSRPGGGYPGVLRGLPVALAGLSPGRFGTVSAQSAWLPTLTSVGCKIYTGGSLMVSGGAALMDQQSAIDDEATIERIKAYIDGFIEFVGQH